MPKVNTNLSVTLRGRRNERSTDPPPRHAVLGSLGVHGVFVALAGFATMPPSPSLMPETIRVRMVAAAPEDAPVRVDPSPPEMAEEEHRPPPPERTPERRLQTENPTVEVEVPVEREPESEPARTEEVGEEAVNVQIDGANALFPAYNRNIIRQIQRYWRPPAGALDLRAEIAFTIHRDGRVSDIEWILHSGSSTFNLLCHGAVESAARDQAFGPLPEAFPAERMRVNFYFDPSVR